VVLRLYYTRRDLATHWNLFHIRNSKASEISFFDLVDDTNTPHGLLGTLVALDGTYPRLSGAS
jgi:hypothetical protein